MDSDGHYDEEIDDDLDYDEDDMPYSDGQYEEDAEMEDTGDSEDTVSDQTAVREAEMLLLISEVQQPQQLHTSNRKKGKSRGRGPTLGLKVTEPMHLQFDHLLRPTGRWRLKYGQQIGFCVRKLNINWEWPDVTEALKQKLWQNTMNWFHIHDDPQLRKNFLSGLASRFRDFKAKLVSGWITCSRKRSKFEDKEPPQIWDHITWEDWAAFKKTKTSPEAKAKRAKAVKSAKMNEHFHHMGQMNYEDSRAMWIKEGFYPACTMGASTESSSSVTVEINRGDDWYCAMHKRDKKTGRRNIEKPKTKAVAAKYLEFREKQTKKDFIPVRNKDALYMALGEKPDHSGRAYGFGGINVGYRKAFGKPTPQANKLGQSGISTADREALKNELREELKQEFNATMKHNLSSLLQEMGITGLRLPDGTPFPLPTAQSNLRNHPHLC